MPKDIIWKMTKKRRERQREREREREKETYCP